MAGGFYNSIFNPNAGSPSAFTSPGMNPQALQQMLQMQGGVGGGGMQPGIGMMPQQQMPQPPQGPGMPQVMGNPQAMQRPQGAGDGMTPQGLQAAIAAMKSGGGMGGSMDMSRMQQIHDLLTKMQGGIGATSMQPPMGMQRPAMPPVPGMFGAQGT